jgi:hypothetical protein
MKLNFIVKYMLSVPVCVYLYVCKLELLIPAYQFWVILIMKSLWKTVWIFEKWNCM